MADDDNSGGDVPPAPREEEAAAAAAEPPPSSSSSPSTSSSSSLLSLSVKNPARSCAPDFGLTARADDSVAELKAKLRAAFKGSYILSGGYDAARANADLQAGHGDLVAFGRPFISNPGLVEKLRSGAALAEPDANSFYTADAKGYTDYPL